MQSYIHTKSNYKRIVLFWSQFAFVRSMYFKLTTNK